MLLGEIAFGGLGSGVYGIVFVALIGVFVAGLMIGRTPTYLGKVLGPTEVKIASLYILGGPCIVLLLTALAVVVPAGLAGLTTNQGAHGLTTILYAFASSFGNNGQAFAGLSADTPFYNCATAFAMLIGRFGLGILALALAGKFAAQSRRAESSAMLKNDTMLFGGIVLFAALVVGGLSFLPALALGPVAEHLQLH
jgi:K+-transporting ATPase ATPase A chain